MPLQAQGTFQVTIRPIPGDAAGMKRMSIEKQIQGDLEATSTGEMMAAGDPKTGQAGYVAMEVVTGKLGDRTGSFALQHKALMDSGGQVLEVLVVPGSGTAELQGIRGQFTIAITDGQHRYDFTYTLPPAL